MRCWWPPRWSHFRNFTDGRPTWDVDGRPENLIRRGKESALALGVDTIDLAVLPPSGSEGAVQRVR